MYSPSSRLLTVLELLQSYKEMSGRELAQRLEVDGRTVRRYIATLQDMGIPIEAERGPNGLYRLLGHYKLPPIMFTDIEAVALILGLLATRELHFPVHIVGVEGALAKTERVMPAKLLSQVRALQAAITFNTPPPVPKVAYAFVVTLSLAIEQERQVILRYRSVQGEESERAFDAYGLVVNQGYWYTTGYCHLRNALRTFRLDRILSLDFGTQSFICPENFDALQHLLDSVVAIPGKYQVAVLLKTTIEHVQQRAWSPKMKIEPCEEGVLLYSNVDQLDWIARFLIGLDFPFTIIQPIELRDVIRNIATNILETV